MRGLQYAYLIYIVNIMQSYVYMRIIIGHIVFHCEYYHRFTSVAVIKYLDQNQIRKEFFELSITGYEPSFAEVMVLGDCCTWSWHICSHGQRETCTHAPCSFAPCQRSPVLHTSEHSD